MHFEDKIEKSKIHFHKCSLQLCFMLSNRTLCVSQQHGCKNHKAKYMFLRKTVCDWLTSSWPLSQSGGSLRDCFSRRLFTSVTSIFVSVIVFSFIFIEYVGSGSVLSVECLCCLSSFSTKSLQMIIFSLCNYGLNSFITFVFLSLVVSSLCLHSWPFGLVKMLSFL